MNKIIEYQKLEENILKLEKELSICDERNIMNKMIILVKDAQNKSNTLEDDAKSLIDEYVEIKKNYDNNVQKVQKISKENANEMDMEKVDKYMVMVNTISSEMFMIERKLNIIIPKIKELLKEFEIARNTAIKARNKHKECKEKFEEKANIIQPKILELKKKMSSLEKSLPKDEFDKYKHLRADNIFPVFVSIHDKVCSACRVEIPSGKLDKLKNNNYIVCEQCRRLIYKDN